MQREGADAFGETPAGAGADVAILVDAHDLLGRGGAALGRVGRGVGGGVEQDARGAGSGCERFDAHANVGDEMLRDAGGGTRGESRDDVVEAAEHRATAGEAEDGVFGEDFAEAGPVAAVANFGVVDGEVVASLLDSEALDVRKVGHVRMGLRSESI